MLTDTSAGSNPLIADSPVFGKSTLTMDRPDTYALFIALEQQSVARPHAEQAPNLARDRDLPLARDLGLLLHMSRQLFPTMLTTLFCRVVPTQGYATNCYVSDETAHDSATPARER